MTTLNNFFDNVEVETKDADNESVLFVFTKQAIACIIQENNEILDIVEFAPIGWDKE